jgi:hypothetical protein
MRRVSAGGSVQQIRLWARLASQPAGFCGSTSQTMTTGAPTGSRTGRSRCPLERTTNLLWPFHHQTSRLPCVSDLLKTYAQAGSVCLKAQKMNADSILGRAVYPPSMTTFSW